MRKLGLIAISMGCFLMISGPDTLAQGYKDPVLIPGPQTPSVSWQARFDGSMSNVDRAAAMAIHPTGTVVYVAGESYGIRHSLDYITLAYDAENGQLLWQHVYDPYWGKNDSATHIAVSPDGSLVFVTGTSIGSGADEGIGDGLGDADWDFVTLAYYAHTGAPMWEQRYHGHQRGEGWTNSMAVSPDGQTVLINGRSNCMDNPQTPEAEPGNATIAYDALTGNELWVACYPVALSWRDYGTQLTVSGDSSVVILSGTEQRHVTGFDIATIAFDLQTGDRLWVRYYDSGLYDPDAPIQDPVFGGADPTFDSARAIASNGAAVYVGGVSRGYYGLLDYVTLAYDVRNGARKGVARFDGALRGTDHANAIAVSPDGARVFVTGESQSAHVGSELVTIAYDERLNNELWRIHHNTSDAPSGEPDGRHDIGRMITVSDDGRYVLVAGDSWGAHSLDWLIVAYDAQTGEQEWSGLYDGVISHADFSRDIVVNGDGSRVYLTGHSCSCGTSGFNIITMGIQADGAAPAETTGLWARPRQTRRSSLGLVRER